MKTYSRSKLAVRTCGEIVLLSSFVGTEVLIWVFSCKKGGKLKLFYVAMLWYKRFFFKELKFLLKEPNSVFLGDILSEIK